MKRLRLADERGFSLVFTILTLLVTSVTLTAVIQFTTSNSRHSTRSKADQIAYGLPGLHRDRLGALVDI